MKKKMVYVFLGFCVLVLSLFFILKNGIAISSIQFDFFTLEQLYIKLDKKLIVRAKKITINEKESASAQDFQDLDSASKELLNTIKRLQYLYTFVEEIDIQNLSIKNNHIRILFKDNEFFVDNDAFFLKLILEHKDNQIEALIEKLLFKEYELNVDGKLSINTKSKFYYFTGKATSQLLDFNATISYKDKALSYKIEDLTLVNLPQLYSKFEKSFILPRNLKLWFVDRIQAQSYHLDFLQGFADLGKNNYYFDDIKAKGFANEVQVFLSDADFPIFVPYLEFDLEKQKLNISFEKASYNTTDLSTSKVYLYDIMQPSKAGIFLHIKSDNVSINEKLYNTLKLYHLNLPFYQKSGTIKTDLTLQIAFNKEIKNLYNGTFLLENSKLSLADFTINKAFIELKQNDLSVNANVKNAFLQADFTAQFDLMMKKGEFDTQIANLNLGDGFFDMKNKALKLNLDYSQGAILSIPEFDTILNFTDGLELKAKNVNAFVKYLPQLRRFGFLGADFVFYKSLNFDDFILNVENARFENNLSVGNKPYQNDSFNVSKNKGIISIHSQSNVFNANLSEQKKEFYVKNLNYIYKKDKNASVGDFDISKYPQNIILNAENVAVILADSNKTLAFDQLKANLQDKVLNAKGVRGVANFDFYYSADGFGLNAKNMDDKYLNEFLQKKAIQEGEFNLNINGSSFEFFSGEFKLKNTYVKDLKGTNQLISFIDTVPSLLLFKSPTFNEKGLSLHSGKVIFNRKKDLLRFDAINLNGDSVDIFGLGTANLRLNELDLDLELKTLKSASQAISKVPILNYVILGKNQEISTNIKVDGSFDEPKFHTQILTDTLKTPFNLIKNIIELPVNLFK